MPVFDTGRSPVSCGPVPKLVRAPPGLFFQAIGFQYVKFVADVAGECVEPSYDRPIGYERVRTETWQWTRFKGNWAGGPI